MGTEKGGPGEHPPPAQADGLRRAQGAVVPACGHPGTKGLALCAPVVRTGRQGHGEGGCSGGHSLITCDLSEVRELLTHTHASAHCVYMGAHTCAHPYTLSTHTYTWVCMCRHTQSHWCHPGPDRTRSDSRADSQYVSKASPATPGHLRG